MGLSKQLNYMKNKSGPCIIFCTCPDKTAQTIANTLVKQTLAACVNIVPNIQSIYKWQGKIQQDDEQLLIIKSRFELFETLEKRLLDLHPYELPEVIAVPIEMGSKQFLEWLDCSTRE